MHTRSPPVLALGLPGLPGCGSGLLNFLQMAPNPVGCSPSEATRTGSAGRKARQFGTLCGGREAGMFLDVIQLHSREQEGRRASPSSWDAGRKLQID